MVCILNSSEKWTKKSTFMIPQVNLFSFVFWRKSKRQLPELYLRGRFSDSLNIERWLEISYIYTLQSRQGQYRARTGISLRNFPTQGKPTFHYRVPRWLKQVFPCWEKYTGNSLFSLQGWVCSALLSWAAQKAQTCSKTWLTDQLYTKLGPTPRPRWGRRSRPSQLELLCTVNNYSHFIVTL